jgi:hypothetical protein
MEYTSETLVWPATLVNFEFHALSPSLASYQLPCHVQTIKILPGATIPVMIPIEFFDRSHIYEQLRFIDFSHNFLLDVTLARLPAPLSRMQVASIHLSGNLCKEDIPATWGPSECRKLSFRWMASHMPHKLITFYEQEAQYPISSTHMHIPEGVQEIIGMEVTRTIPFLDLPRSLTAIPPSYGPLKLSEYDLFPNIDMDPSMKPAQQKEQNCATT